jgi:hypothetical protein
MLKLNSQFDLRCRYSAESGAAGGSTSSTSSCCLVTFGLATVATSMHFQTLKEVVPVPVVPYAPPEGHADGGGSGVLGFLLPVMTLVWAVFLAIMSKNEVITLGGALALWLLIWVAAYRHAGRPTWLGVLMALLALGAMAAVGFFEMRLWFGH